VSPLDFVDAVRRRPPGEGGDGKCRTRSGEPVDLELYKFDSCPYCQHVYRAVRRLGVPVRYRDITREAAAARTLVQVGGLDQVPCLFIDGKPLYESADIVAFLERNFERAHG
jgi:glutaredoxin